MSKEKRVAAPHTSLPEHRTESGLEPGGRSLIAVTQDPQPQVCGCLRSHLTVPRAGVSQLSLLTAHRVLDPLGTAGLGA